MQHATLLQLYTTAACVVIAFFHAKVADDKILAFDKGMIAISTKDTLLWYTVQPRIFVHHAKLLF